MGEYLPTGLPHTPKPRGKLMRIDLIASLDELTPEDRRHVAALVESLRNRAPAEPPDR